jgi:integrase
MTKQTGHQTGHIFRAGRFWYGRWRRDELVKGNDGESRIERKQHCEKLCEYSDRYRTKRDVQPLLTSKLRPLNERRYSPEGTLTIAEYAEKFFIPYAERELKPSTVYGYKGLLRMYLTPRLRAKNLLDCRCVDVTNILATIHEEHHLGRTTLRHCKALLSSIFRHAKQSGAKDGENPAKDAGIPRSAQAGKPTHAYTPTEVMAMLSALDGVARTAIALMFFCALRPGEARAARWEDYDGKTLRIRSSMWKGFLTDPKTADSVATQLVPETLSEILAETKRETGFILTSPSGKPIDLCNLTTRAIVPSLSRCAVCKKDKDQHQTDHEFSPLPKWRGFYGLRRGLATLAASLDTPLASKSLLRHSNIATTNAFYIKSVSSDAVRAVAKMDALFQNGFGDAVPN